MPLLSMTIEITHSYSLFLHLLLVFLGVALLISGGSLLVKGSVALSIKKGISPLIIGLTVMAIGTSLPELALNISAAIQNLPDLCFGNIIGSNIANLSLVLGCTACITSLPASNGVRNNCTFLGAAGLFPLIPWLMEKPYSREFGLILILFLFVILYAWTKIKMFKDTNDNQINTVEKKLALNNPILYILTGIPMLGLGGVITTTGAEGSAFHLGISSTTIGLTLVAISTSLPELIASIISAKSNQVKLALGNLFGSNIFNVFLVLGISNLITPLPFKFLNEPEGWKSIVLMTFITLITIIFVLKFKKIHRFLGPILVLLWISLIFII